MGERISKALQGLFSDDRKSTWKLWMTLVLPDVDVVGRSNLNLCLVNVIRPTIKRFAMRFAIYILRRPIFKRWKVLARKAW